MVGSGLEGVGLPSRVASWAASATSDDAAAMRAVIETAHGSGKKVTAHAGPAGVIRAAIDCGLDGVEHGYFLDEETVLLMVERGVWLVPTIVVSRFIPQTPFVGKTDARRRGRHCGEPHQYPPARGLSTAAASGRLR